MNRRHAFIGYGWLVCTLGGCIEPGISRAPTNNAHIDVETLLTHDGCTVYRFRDVAYHYFVRCLDARAASTIDCSGKGCTRDETITTVPASGVATPAR